MIFYKNTKIEDFDDKSVDIILSPVPSEAIPEEDNSEKICYTIALCHSFIKNDKLFIDLIPEKKGKYIVQVPEDSILSKNDSELMMGRWCIVIMPNTKAGIVIKTLIEQGKTLIERLK